MSAARTPIAILVDNPAFLVAAKPPGMETISQDGGPELTRLLREETNDSGIVPVHRLDRDTSGAQLLARTPAAEKTLTTLFRRREVDKIYLAICLGAPRNAAGRINRNLSEWTGGRRPVRVLKQGGLEAQTTYRVLAAAPRLADGFAASLIAFSPHQGRTHQIRVHAAALGYPILGDDQYGDRAANRQAAILLGLKRQALHSLRLAFSWSGAPATAFCPPFADMATAIRQAFGESALATLDAVSSVE